MPVCFLLGFLKHCHFCGTLLTCLHFEKKTLQIFLNFNEFNFQIGDLKELSIEPDLKRSFELILVLSAGGSYPCIPLQTRRAGTLSVGSNV